jgi:integrase/recombinase XerD
MSNEPGPTISQALPGFIEYMTAERRFSINTVQRYRYNVNCFRRDVGDLLLGEIKPMHFIALKSRMSARGARASRIAGVIFAMKSLLTFARDFLGVAVLDVKNIAVPREPRREVLYLTEEEVAKFIAAITLETSLPRHPHLAGYCYRALVETLLGSGMRISEALSLNRDSIDFEAREAVIIGKGNRQRPVFFTARALEWVSRYLDLRADSDRALFVSAATGRRLTRDAVELMFRRLSRAAGMEKTVTPHILRHTTATRLLHKGCPIGFIKEVLGHQRLETTCHFYLGTLSKADTKKAFESYMTDTEIE